LIFGVLWLLLLWKGGRNGRIIGILLVPMIVIGDQLCSQVLKGIVLRPRPCHTVDGLPVIDHVRLLVPCGSGYSFPSSHAFNNFAFATYLTAHFRKRWWVWFSYAFLIGLSRVVVGVHFPSDVLGGAILGSIFAGIYLVLIGQIANWVPALRLTDPEHTMLSAKQ
jgi:undecaprenyl-diphosphatase